MFGFRLMTVLDCCCAPEPCGHRVRSVLQSAGGSHCTFACAQRSIGKATDHVPDTDCHQTELNDGECDEFNDDNMACFRLIKEFSPRNCSTGASQVARKTDSSASGNRDPIAASAMLSSSAHSGTPRAPTSCLCVQTVRRAR